MITIGLPFTPSKMIKKETKVGYRITLSWGGGIGGSTIDLFTLEDVPTMLKTSPQFITINDNVAKGEVINTSFIVRVTPVKLIHTVVENLGNNNFESRSENYYHCDVNEELTFVDMYTFDTYNHILGSTNCKNPAFFKSVKS